jgi:hypothetical protein
MRVAALLLVLFTAARSYAVLAQTAPAAGVAPDTEEVVVRGRRLTDLRFEVELAQERAYAIFNELNSDDDFDVHCRDERRHHSRATVRTCRAQFENRISAEAAREYMAALAWTCQPSADPNGFATLNTQACMFSNNGQSAAAAARAVEGQLPTKHEQMNDEIIRLANEDDRFAQAILDWYETNQHYESARKHRRGED